MPNKKRFSYRCRCRKEPMRGSFNVGPAGDKEEVLVAILDESWAKTHNKPDCVTIARVIEPVPSKKPK